MAVLLNAYGVPQAPTEIVARLKRISPLLDLKFVAFPSTEGNVQQWWAVVQDWTEQDNRRANVMDGSVPPDKAFDIIGYLPLDATPHDCFGYITNKLQRMRDHPRIHVDRLLANIDRYNDSVRAEVMRPVEEFADELIKTNAKTMFKDEGKHIPKVFLNDSTRNK